MFRAVPNKMNLPEVEQRILKFWQDHKIFEKSLEKRSKGPWYIFYEGPPTANGKPGIHHVIARAVKDIVCRYKTMNGYYVPRKAGWDTHGLPVEIAVEKEMGLTQKNEIEKIGIDKFNKACKALVDRHIEMDEGWRTLTDRMGYWIDLDNAYITYKNEYIESVWWAIKQIFDKGLIYRGFKIVPQSPTIETPLSSHELSLGYREVRDPNCYVKVKILSSPKKELAGKRLLVWTTTPWTLLSNTAMAVGENIDYVLVKNTRQIKSGDQKETVTDELVLAEARLEALDGEYEILDRFKGRELIGTRYEPLFDYFKPDTEKYPNAFTVLTADFVSTEDGSGIVHLAPAFGQDDYEMSKKFNLPFFQPVTPGGRLTDDVGEFAGRTVKTFTYTDHTEEGVDKDIVIALKKMDKLYRNSFDYVHSYPHCWRTDNPIIYYARESWFINSPAYKENMIELNKTINWQPPEIGKGRFGNWLEDVKEWSLSRDRYWGTPLPIWVSEDNEDLLAVGSIEELKKGLFEKEDGTLVPLSELDEEIDLHRPFVDRVVFKKDGKTYRRTPEIIDVWFDSGSMPFAQFHYPFENKELFEKSFPADFIAEGIDQTRGWFYTLHNIATILFNKPAFKNIIVNELILDKDGQKMSKSRGNVVYPLEMMDKYGADALRWYFMAVSPPWIPKRFDENGLLEIVRKFFTTLYNVYSFFVLYANIDHFDADQPQIPFEERPEIDRWILSRLYSVAGEVGGHLENYDITKAARALSDYMIDDVSNWYVRRNRRRFWKSEAGSDKTAAYQTLHEVLLTFARLMAPLAPFIAEEIYLNLKRKNDAESVHLERYPQMDDEKKARRDSSLEQRMALAQKVVSIVRALRNDRQIKVRQPLSRVVLHSSDASVKKAAQEMAGIICEEINVKKLEFVDDENELVSKNAKPNFKVLGAKVGKMMGQLAGVIKSFGPEQINELEQNGKTHVHVDGHEVHLEVEDVEIVAEPKADFAVQSEAGLIVALDLKITPELREEGLAREFVNRVQNLRKDAGFEVMDHIVIQIDHLPDSLDTAIHNQEKYICNETLADKIVFGTVTAAFVNDVTIEKETFKVGLEKSK
ncbi:MAG TPA: isoleucine--tRNA ligase [Caldithrix abyssi]|uniref:Isoleucine--tRNA ligase n=1 Tax=Caldithrix abyssi TaxID=187145 RepID=A0A7V4WUK8_CALAY|nr:isoleucine--tRNA ligase [Caldithrix abyssi]